jgi:C-terminal processing protease CtpA/Prc
MFTGADAALKKALEGKSSVTIDLRNSSLADFESIGSVLNILAPKGSYGKLTSRSAANSSSLNSTGASKLQLTLIVDESTRGASEILAHALRDAGVAKWIGTKTSGELSMIKTVVLPDGSAYTLPVAKYEALKK